MSDDLKTVLSAFDAELPLERASTIPSAWYTREDVARLEREHVFGKNWIYAGRVDQVAQPGDFFTTDIAGDPILVTRDKQGELHAMINICRHRAARVECRSEGNASRLRCRYHGWAYDLSGRLVGTPDFDDVCEFEKTGLPKIAVDTFGPFVFVNMERNSGSLAQFLSPIPDREEFADAKGLKFAGRQSYTMECNWKIFIDNYLDGGYHIPTLHPGLAKVVRMEDYQTLLFDRVNVQESPLRESRDETLNKTRSGDKAFYWWIYPNFMVNLYDGVMDTNWVVPIAPDRCLCVFEFYFADVESDKAKAFIAESLQVADQVQDEDMEICAEVQRGLASQHYDTGRFSVRREAGGLHFHRQLARDLRNHLS